MSKLRTAIFVAVLLVPVAILVGLAEKLARPDCFTCGVTVTYTFWFIGVSAYGPILWAKNPLSFSQRFGLWLAALVVGFCMYISIELLAASLIFSSFDWALALGSAANWIGAIAASAASGLLVRRLSGRTSQPLAPTRSSPQTPDAHTRSQTHKDGARGILSAVTTGERIWRVTFFALSSVAAVLVALVAIQLVNDHYGEKPVATVGNTPDPFRRYIRDERVATVDDTPAPSPQSIRDDDVPLRGVPVAIRSTDALLAEYEDNEFAAAAKYENEESVRRQCAAGYGNDDCRVVEIAGIIRDMGRDDMGNAYIRLATADQIGSVEARFGKLHKSLESLHRGQRVSVHCMVLYDSTGRLPALLLLRCGVVP